MQNKRKYDRYPIVLQVEVIFSDGRTMQLNTEDMSDGGVFLRLDAGQPWPKVGDRLHVRLKGLLAGQSPPLVTAQVARVTERGIGLQFLTGS